jgi:hypothetical protein
VSPARRRLAARAAAAGYSPGALALVAQAALPGYRPGDTLDELLVDHVRTAVELLAQAGQGGDTLGALLANYHRRYGEHWREHFWRHQLWLAAVRRGVPVPGGRTA